MLATVIGFVVSKPIISKLGVTKTIQLGLMGAAIPSLIRCFIPENFMVYAATSLVASFIQIPLMCLYGVYSNDGRLYEWKYEELVAMSGGAIGFGSKWGSGLGSVILSAFLAIGGYQASLESATASMRYSIYGFSNYLPLVVNLAMFLIFTRFDLEEKITKDAGRSTCEKREKINGETTRSVQERLYRLCSCHSIYRNCQWQAL